MVLCIDILTIRDTILEDLFSSLTSFMENDAMSANHGGRAQVRINSSGESKMSLARRLGAQTPRVVRAREKVRNGTLETPEIMSAATDRLLNKEAKGLKGSKPRLDETIVEVKPTKPSRQPRNVSRPQCLRCERVKTSTRDGFRCDNPNCPGKTANLN